MKELKLKKCLKCGAIVKVINDCDCDDCGIKCCGEQMTLVKSNSVDAAIEKHKPVYTTNEDELIVTVNHVMDEEHYIEWICLVSDNIESYVYYEPGDEIIAKFPNVKTGKLYAYCNKHGLWETEIK